jgi:hypothetical protein
MSTCNKSRKHGTKHTNTKTRLSFDTTTVCPRVRAGKPCAYCYVDNHRKNGTFRAKSVIDYERYNGWVSVLRQSDIDALNAMGGIRMFAFGDYIPAHRDDVRRFLDDCAARRLFAKAITKVPVFVTHFHDHPAISAIHISVDTLRRGGSPITHERAQKLRAQFNKVAVRCVCLGHDDVAWARGRDWIDILTLNHVMIKGMHYFTRREKEEIGRANPGRVCCVGKTCGDCAVTCLVGNGKLRRSNGRNRAKGRRS